MSRWLIFGTALGIFLVDCACLPIQSENMAVALKNEKDRYVFIRGGEGAVLLITCPSGIGSVIVTWVATAAPKPFRIGLRYAKGDPFERLEGIHVTSSTGDKWSELPRRSRLGYLEVEIPDAAFDQDPGSMKIDWVDVYR